jgi:predicted metal-dependent peptidase
MADVKKEPTDYKKVTIGILSTVVASLLITGILHSCNNLKLPAHKREEEKINKKMDNMINQSIEKTVNYEVFKNNVHHMKIAIDSNTANYRSMHTVLDKLVLTVNEIYHMVKPKDTVPAIVTSE